MGRRLDLLAASQPADRRPPACVLAVSMLMNTFGPLGRRQLHQCAAPVAPVRQRGPASAANNIWPKCKTKTMPRLWGPAPRRSRGAQLSSWVGPPAGTRAAGAQCNGGPQWPAATGPLWPTGATRLTGLSPIEWPPAVGPSERRWATGRRTPDGRAYWVYLGLAAVWGGRIQRWRRRRAVYNLWPPSVSSPTDTESCCLSVGQPSGPTHIFQSGRQRNLCRARQASTEEPPRAAANKDRIRSGGTRRAATRANREPPRCCGASLPPARWSPRRLAPFASQRAQTMRAPRRMQPADLVEPRACRRPGAGRRVPIAVRARARPSSHFRST